MTTKEKRFNKTVKNFLKFYKSNRRKISLETQKDDARRYEMEMWDEKRNKGVKKFV